MIDNSKIKDLRLARKIKVSDLLLELYRTQNLKISRVTWHNFEIGRHNISAEKLEKIAKFFDKSILYFFKDNSLIPAKKPKKHVKFFDKVHSVLFKRGV